MYDLYKQKSHQIFQRVFHENTFEIKKKKVIWTLWGIVLPFAVSMQRILNSTHIY